MYIVGSGQYMGEISYRKEVQSKASKKLNLFTGELSVRVRALIY